ncbi:VWA domain-containing protein [Larsenimonas salina]|uniref:VWA domain-containing protein n=1 Tax=Larsenimonas salina TaxID=1295565 RepID=UPI0020744EF3|nr:vWA domain-containing protein [Larsenimonas salina]MCM5705752.1 VWA domain-containing protein [Larsenimonas salina]
MRARVIGRAVACAVVWLWCAAASAAPTVQLIADVSGSMKSNDPANLRATGIGLWGTLLPKDTQAGLWTFGSQVDNPVPLDKVDGAWRQSVEAALPRLSAYQQFTDIESALTKALAAVPDTDEPAHVILLTDGMVDLPGASGQAKTRKDAESRSRLLESVIEDYRQRGVAIDTIALSGGADTELLSTLSRQTGGLSSVAETPATLMRSFLDAMTQVTPFQRVPLGSDQRFFLDDQVNGMTALVFRDDSTSSPLSLIGPDGQRMTARAPGRSDWRHEARFDLITLDRPTPGEWRLDGSVGPGSRILIDSPVKLALESGEPTLYQFFPRDITARLTDNDAPATPESLGVTPLSMRATLVGSDGRTLSDTPLTPSDDGAVYSGRLSAETLGNAQLRVQAQGEGMTRLRVAQVNVAPPLEPSLDASHGVIMVEARAPKLTHDNTRISATLLGQSLDVTTAAARTWQVRLPDELPSQSVPVELKATIDLPMLSRTIDLPSVTLNEQARVALSGAGERAALKGQSMEDAQASEQDAEGPSALENLWSKAQAAWPEVVAWAERQPEWARWAALGVGVLVVLLLVLGGRRRPEPRRREPHLGEDDNDPRL